MNSKVGFLSEEIFGKAKKLKSANCYALIPVLTPCSIELNTPQELAELDKFIEHEIANDFVRLIYDLYCSVYFKILYHDERRYYSHHNSIASFSIKIGHFETALESLSRLESFVVSESSSVDEIIAFRLQYARAYRGIGDVQNAFLQYAFALKEANGDRYLEARALLMIGKTYHTYYWRLGLYESFVVAAINRLKGELNSKQIEKDRVKKVERLLGIAYDSRANLVYERHRSLSNVLESEEVLETLSKWWDKAEKYTVKSGRTNSLNRIKCKRAYATFYLATTEEGKANAFGAMDSVVNNTRSENIRGLAVRYFQLSDMLIEFGNFDLAEIRLSSALKYSERLSDWRTYVKCKIALAKAWRLTGQYNESLLALDAAERALKYTGQTLPELLVEIFIERFRLYSRDNDYIRASIEIKKGRAVLDSLVDSFYANNASIHLASPNSLRVPANIKSIFNKTLTDTEYRNITKSGDDFRLLAWLQKRLLSMIEEQQELAKDHSARKMSLLFWQDMAVGQGHSVTSSIRIMKEQISERLTNIKVGSDIENRSDRYEEVLRHLIDEFDLLSSEIKSRSSRLESDEVVFSSVFELFNRVVNEMPLGGNRARIPISVSLVNQGDFEIRCVPAIFEMVASELIQNALKALSKNNRNSSGYVHINIGWLTSGVGGLDKGVIQVLDNAGGAITLKQSWDDLRQSGTGLNQIKLFFGKYASNYEISEAYNQDTILSISLASGGDVAKLSIND